MINANEARVMTNEFKTREIAKMNEYANFHAEAICEEIAILANEGKDRIIVPIKDDLLNDDLRARVKAIFKNNGYYVDGNWKRKELTIMW